LMVEAVVDDLMVEEEDFLVGLMVEVVVRLCRRLRTWVGVGDRRPCPWAAVDIMVRLLHLDLRDTMECLPDKVSFCQI
jgi:hypothetical protein